MKPSSSHKRVAASRNQPSGRRAEVPNAHPAISMEQRYARALHFTEPKAAAEVPAPGVEGYWIDDTHFYFLAERFDKALGRIVSIPSIANATSRKVEEIVPLDVLLRLLSEQAGQPIELVDLAAAEFDLADRNTLVVSLPGRDCWIDRWARRIVRSAPPLGQPALYSPDGRYACAVKGHDLWLRDRETSAERALTTDGAAHWRYGQQSETCLAAVSYRQCPSPVGLWSTDSQWFLTHRIDERILPELTLMQNVPPAGRRPIVHSFKYSMPGDPLPTATYVAVHVATGSIVSFDDFPAPLTAFSPFSFRMVWFSAASKAWFIRFDRYFKRADLICLNLQEGSGRIVLSETAPSGYLDLNPMIAATPNVRTVASTNEIIWYSERDGWGHLYLYDALTGALKRQLTRGEWMVRDIVHVDEAQRRILFLAGGIDPKADPARRSLCAVDLSGSGFEVLLSHHGDTSVPITEPCGLGQERPHRSNSSQPGISPTGRYSIVQFSSVDRGDVTEIIDLQSGRAFPIASSMPKASDVPPLQFHALAADGKTLLHGVLFFASDFDERRRYPLIDYIYPGPQFGQKPQAFRSLKSAQARALAELGCISLMLDTRGTPGGSRAFHQIGYGALCEPQLADHAAVIRQLCDRYAFIDRERIGMIGQSGGGSATARALCDYGDLFKVGIAVCGNHDASRYLAVWSDKYRGPGTPEEWASQGNNAVAHKLKGKLLLISGDMDENVHVSHTLSFVDALIRANRDFDLLIVPNAGHDVLMGNGYALRRVWDYIVRHLLADVPPTDFEIRFEPHEMARYRSFLGAFMRETRR